MDEEQIQEMVDYMKAHTEEIKTNPEKALEFLILAGFVDENGDPTEPYK